MVRNMQIHLYNIRYIGIVVYTVVSPGRGSNIHVGLAATTPHDGLHTRLPLLDKSGCTFLPNTHCAGCPGRLAARVVAPLQGSMLSLGPSIVYRQYCPLHRQADAEGFGREVSTPSAPCGRWRWMLLLSDVYSTIHIDNNTYCGIYGYMTIYLYYLFLGAPDKPRGAEFMALTQKLLIIGTFDH